MTNEATDAVLSLSDDELMARISGLRSDIALAEQSDRPAGKSRTATLRARLTELEAELEARHQ